jgi:cysteine synthase A
MSHPLRGGQGQHRIEGIGDKMVTLIHNVFNSDLLMLIHDEDTVRGMEVMQSGTHILVERLGVPSAIACELFGKFGQAASATSSARSRPRSYLGLGPDDNVVTIATDSYDRYPSVSQALYGRNGGKPDDDQLELWAKSVFLGASLGEIVDLTSRPARASAKDEEPTCGRASATTPTTSARWPARIFWDAEYAKIQEIDPVIAETRGKIG